jgi:hypothetical protein
VIFLGQILDYMWKQLTVRCRFDEINAFSVAKQRS